MTVKILNPLTWAAQNKAWLVGAIVFGLVDVILNALHVNLLLGVGHALAFACAGWAMAAYHALTDSTTTAG